MSSLLSRAFSRRPSFPRLSCIALLVAGLGLASCGGDDDDSPPPAVKQADQVGTLHGVLAAALQEELGIGAPLTNLSAPVEALQDIVILSDPNGIHDAHPALPLMKDAFYSGRAVVLENVNAKEVNTLIKALRLRISAFTLPEGKSAVALFAVRKVKNDTWFFVDLGVTGDGYEMIEEAPRGGGQDGPSFPFHKNDVWVECRMGPSGSLYDQIEGHVIKDGGTVGCAGASSSGSADSAEGARQQAQQCEAAKQALGAPRALSPTLAKAIRASTEPVEETGVDPDCNGNNPNSVCGPMRSRALLNWAQRGREEAARPPQSVVLRNAGDTTPPYDPAGKLLWTYNFPPEGREFTIDYEISSYHSFKEDVDYYFIRQSGSFNPCAGSNNCRYDPATCDTWTGDSAYMFGHIQYYEFEHAWPAVNDSPERYAPDPYHFTVNTTYSPVNLNSSYSVTVGTDKSLEGSIGFSAGYSKASASSDAAPLAGGPTGSVSGSLGVGIHKSTTTEKTFQEATLTFHTDGRWMGGLNWRYDFPRPCTRGHCSTGLGILTEFGNLEDATPLAKIPFFPWHEWTWRAPSQYTRKYFLEPGKDAPGYTTSGFQAYFQAMTGKSWGYAELTKVGLYTTHLCHKRMYAHFSVPVSRPPLMAVNNPDGLKDFPVGGGSQVLNLGSEYNWKVYEKPKWVKVKPKSGGRTSQDEENKTKYTDWDGSVDFRVSVDPAEGLSKVRTGTVKICALPTYGYTYEPGEEPNPVDENGCIAEGGEEVWFDVAQTPY